MGGLTLDANTLYADMCFFKPLFTYIATVGKGLTRFIDILICLLGSNTSFP